MSDENDSWFKPFGFDPAKFAADTLKTVENTAATAVQDVKAVVQKVDSVVSSGITTVVKTVASAVTPSGGAPASSSSGGGAASSISSLGGSVGRGGKNNPEDVKGIQRALGISDDGKCGPGTIQAIEDFQRSLGQAKPDGRIDPGGPTSRALAGGAKGVPAAAPSSPPAEGADDSGSLFDRAVKGVKDLGGKIVKEAEEDFDAAKALGGNALQSAKNALGDPSNARTSLDGRSEQDLADGIIQAMKSGRDLSFLLGRFRSMPMEEVLDVMSRLKSAGKLQDFQNRLPSGNPRIAVAMFTVKPEFSSEWQKLVVTLNDADRKAILARTPKDVRVERGFGPDPADSKASDKDDDEDDGNESVTLEDVVAVQAKLEFKAKGTNLGKTEFTVKLGPDGKLSGVEVNLTLIQEKLKKMGALAPILELEGSLSLNAEAGLDQQDTKLVFDGVKAAVKGEVQLRFKQIPVLKAVRFKLSATAGTDGVGLGGTIEIPIPGT